MDATTVGSRIRVVHTNDPAIRRGDTGVVAGFGLLGGQPVIEVEWDRPIPNDPALVASFGDEWEILPTTTTTTTERG